MWYLPEGIYSCCTGPILEHWPMYILNIDLQPFLQLEMVNCSPTELCLSTWCMCYLTSSARCSTTSMASTIVRLVLHWTCMEYDGPVPYSLFAHLQSLLYCISGYKKVWNNLLHNSILFLYDCIHVRIQTCINEDIQCINIECVCTLINILFMNLCKYWSVYVIIYCNPARLTSTFNFE